MKRSGSRPGPATEESGSPWVRTLSLGSQPAAGASGGGQVSLSPAGSTVEGFDRDRLYAIVRRLSLCRIRLVDQDTSLSRRRSGVRIPHAVPRLSGQD